MNKQSVTLYVCESRLMRLVLAVICATGVMNGSASAQTYTVTDLGTLGGSFSTPLAINAAGQVTGVSTVNNSFNMHAFLFSGVLTDVGTLGGTSSQGLALNGNGQ